MFSSRAVATSQPSGTCDRAHTPHRADQRESDGSGTKEICKGKVGHHADAERHVPQHADQKQLLQHPTAANDAKSVQQPRDLVLRGTTPEMTVRHRDKQREATSAISSHIKPAAVSDDSITQRRLKRSATQPASGDTSADRPRLASMVIDSHAVEWVWAKTSTKSAVRPAKSPPTVMPRPHAKRRTARRESTAVDMLPVCRWPARACRFISRRSGVPP